MTALDQAHGDRGGDRRLADAALAHDHDQAVLGRRQLIDQRVKAGQIRLGCRRAGCRRRRSRA